MCMFVCLFEHVYLYLYVYVYVSLCIFMSLCLCAYIWVSEHLCIFLCMYICMPVSLCVHTCLYLCVIVYLYIFHLRIYMNVFRTNNTTEKNAEEGMVLSLEGDLEPSGSALQLGAADQKLQDSCQTRHFTEPSFVT